MCVSPTYVCLYRYSMTWTRVCVLKYINTRGLFLSDYVLTTTFEGLYLSKDCLRDYV